MVQFKAKFPEIGVLSGISASGSMVNIMFSKDELSEFIDKYNLSEQLKNTDIADFAKKQKTDQSLKEMHTFMKDDLTSFNIHCIFTSEYSSAARKITIYAANFINNGQVMSIDDIITESTISFVAKDLKEQHSLASDITNLRPKTHVLTGSELVSRCDGTYRGKETLIVKDINSGHQSQILYLLNASSSDACSLLGFNKSQGFTDLFFSDIKSPYLL